MRRCIWPWWVGDYDGALRVEQQGGQDIESVADVHDHTSSEWHGCTHRFDSSGGCGPGMLSSQSPGRSRRPAPNLSAMPVATRRRHMMRTSSCGARLVAPVGPREGPSAY